MRKNEKNVGLWKKIGCMKTKNSDSHLIHSPREAQNIFTERNPKENWNQQNQEDGCQGKVVLPFSPKQKQNPKRDQPPLFELNNQFSLGGQSLSSPRKEPLGNRRGDLFILQNSLNRETFKQQLKDSLMLIESVKRFLLDVKINLLEYGEEFKKCVENDLFCILDILTVYKQLAASKKALVEEHTKLKGILEMAQSQIQSKKKENDILTQNIQEILSERQNSNWVMKELEKNNRSLKQEKQKLVRQNDEIKEQLVSLRKKMITLTNNNLRSIMEVENHASEVRLRNESKRKLEILLTKHRQIGSVKAPFTESVYPLDKQPLMDNSSGLENNRNYENIIGKAQSKVTTRLNKTSRQKNRNFRNGGLPTKKMGGTHLPSSYSYKGLGSLEYRLNNIKTQITNQLKQAKIMFK